MKPTWLPAIIFFVVAPLPWPPSTPMVSENSFNHGRAAIVDQFNQLVHGNYQDFKSASSVIL